MADYLDALAEFAANFAAAELPDAVSNHTKLIIADTFGAIVGGSVEPEVRALADSLCDETGGSATVLGIGKTATPALAALINGTAGTFLEMDEGNGPAMGHPAIHTVPATFAAAEKHGTSGPDFIAAVAIGYEVGGRIGGATHLRGSMHPHGTWGTICAAVGVGRVLGFDAVQMRSLLNIASNMCLATSRPTMLQGATVRNAYAGISGQLGHLSCDLVRAGFTGEHDGIANVFGNVVSTNFDPALAINGLGQDWIVARNYFKLHACCRYNHGALDALAEITSTHPEVGPDAVGNIARIDIASYDLAAELNDQAPDNMLAAKFSVPFAIATTLINGTSTVEAFTLDNVRTEAIQDLTKRVFITEDPAMTAQRSDLEARPASVKVTMTDGQTFEASNIINQGSPSDPYTTEQLRQKYDSLAIRAWSAADAAEVHDAIMALDQGGDTEELRMTVLRANAKRKT